MSFSDIKGKRLLKVIADCAGPLSNIMSDQRVMDLLTRKECPDGVDPRSFMVQRTLDALPALFGDHADDLTEVLGIVAVNSPEGVESGLTVEQYAETGDVLGDLARLITDEAFTGFLARV